MTLGKANVPFADRRSLFAAGEVALPHQSGKGSIVEKLNQVNPDNHNYKRITRMLTFLRNLELIYLLDSTSDAFDVLSKKWHTEIGERTIEFWISASSLSME